MSLFRKLREPIFFEVSNSAGLKLEQLQSIDASRLPAGARDKLDADVKKTTLGIKGESNVAYELKNSSMPMAVIQDLYLEQGTSSAQIDFLVITRKCVFVIECKNLYGNIQINNNGSFVRTGDWRTKIEEGMYSPVRQNQIHLDVIKKLRFKEKGLFTSEATFEREFNNVFCPVVVLANERSVLNDRYAPADVKALVTRSDSLVEYIASINNYSNAPVLSDKQMETLTMFFVNANVERSVDYAKTFRDEMIQEDKNACPVCPKCGNEMVQREAKKGPTAGKKFWGCPGFPKCDGTAKVNEGN